MSEHQLNEMNNTAIIIVAAGSASRFGNIKQLLHFNNKTLLQHAIDEGVDAGAGSVIVVTGAHADEILKNINQNIKLMILFIAQRKIDNEQVHHQ